MGELQQQRNKTDPLSDELWLIANNSKSFVKGSKSIIRNNLHLCKGSEIYLVWNFWKESGVMTQGRREVEVGTLLLSDENSVIAENVLSYF